MHLCADIYPPVHPLPWITAVLHKARPAQVDHGDDDDDDGDDDDDDDGYHRFFWFFSALFSSSIYTLLVWFV